MRVQFFVSGSAALLALWLGVTFFRKVPQDNYPVLGKGSMPVSAKVEKTEPAPPEQAPVEEKPSMAME